MNVLCGSIDYGMDVVFSNVNIINKGKRILRLCIVHVHWFNNVEIILLKYLL